MKTSFLNTAGELPLVVEPASRNDAGLECLLDWLAGRRTWMASQLVQHGALLLRGFEVRLPEDFKRFCTTLDPQLLDYAGGDSPRKAVTGKVYTSTEYPANLEIPLHNELSYRLCWPRRLFFFCQQPAAEGGETCIADSRGILQSIDPGIRQRFAERQIAYLQNLHDGWGLGKSWQETFETDDRDEVEARCRKSGIEFRWTDNGLWTRSICPAVIGHPQTGEAAWFNQADLWHVSSRGQANMKKLLEVLGEAALPAHATYGDGSPITVGELQAVRRAYGANEHVFPWQRGDVLVLDNVLVAHGRKPFRGARRVLVAMANEICLSPLDTSREIISNTG